MRQLWSSTDTGPWTRRILAIIIMLVVYLHVLHGALIVRVLYLILLFGQCVLILIPRKRVSRRMSFSAVVLAILLVGVMIALGDRVSNATDLLWPITFWLPVMEQEGDAVSITLFVILALIDVLGSGLPTFVDGVEVVGLIVGYFGIRAQKQRRLSHEALVRAHRELEQATLETIQHATSNERLRIAQDMHDGVGHQLTSLIVQLEALQYAIAVQDAEALKMNEQALNTARSSLAELRGAVWQIERFDEEDAAMTAFKALIRKFESTTGLSCHATIDLSLEQVSVAKERALTLYRVLQEALTNVARHSQATHVRVRMEATSTEYVLVVEDDGILDSIAALKEGFGVRTMRDRSVQMGGNLELYVCQPHGLGVRATIPAGLRGQAT